MHLNNFVEVCDGVLSESQCESIIEKFDNEPNRIDAGVCKHQKYIQDDLSIKCQEFYINNSESWESTSRLLYDTVGKLFTQYVLKHEDFIGRILKESVQDSGYVISKYEKGQGHFSWHSDTGVEATREFEGNNRILAMIIYLNDVRVGGATEFKWKTSCSAKTGRALIFPATWEFVHRGQIPQSDDKYIVTTFIGQKMPLY